MAIPNAHPEKSSLRAKMRRALKQSNASDAPVLAKLEGWLKEHPEIRTLAIYAALPGEVQLAHLIPRHHHRRWTFPKIHGNTLVFHEVTNPDSDLSVGSFGIQEPRPHLPKIPLCEIDAFLCPGLAFDHSGNRLGRGKGFYDRMLLQARTDALKLGICHDFQLIGQIQTEPHDIAMDQVISA